MQTDILGALFPIFALIALGFSCGRAGWIGEGSDLILSAFVGKIALPALTFQVLASAKPDDLAQPVMAAVVVGSSWLIYLGHFLFERRYGLDPARANFAALGAAFGNNAFVGLPICIAFLGPASLGPAAVVIALNTAFVFGGGAVAWALMSGTNDSAGGRLVAAFRLVAGNPLVLSAAAGVACAFSGVGLPDPVSDVLRALGGTTAPCALVAIGMFVSRPLPRAGGTGATWRSITGKLVFLPAATAVMLSVLPPLPAIWRDTALVMAATPVGASCFVLACDAGDEPMRLASRLVVLSTLMAAATLPIMLWIVKAGG